MKNLNIIPGIILIGFGIYYYSQQIGLSLFEQFHTWPTLLGIVGVAFLVHGYWGNAVESILPGVIFFGFSLHLHVVERLQIWPDHLGAFILVLSLGFLLRYQKTGNGLFHGVLFLILSGVLLFYDEIANKVGNEPGVVSFVLNNWALILVVIGIYLLVRKGK